MKVQCFRPITIYGGKNWRFKSGEGMEVPCGKCIGCKKQRARDWSVRLLHELSYHKRSCFITLTYDDEHYPENGSISKRELQLFFKRLRKAYEWREQVIKYFACGEYGERTNRAHYHSIIFGVGFRELKPYQVSTKDSKPVFSSVELERLWSLGNVTIGSVDIKSINYVTGYIRKKLGSREYGTLEPPFQLQSQGLGLEYAKENENKVVNLGLTLQGNKVTTPRYYLKKLGINRDRANELMEKRSDQINKVAKERKISWNDVAIEDREQRERNQKAKDDLFKRGKI